MSVDIKPVAGNEGEHVCKEAKEPVGSKGASIYFEPVAFKFQCHQNLSDDCMGHCYLN